MGYRVFTQTDYEILPKLLSKKFNLLKRPPPNRRFDD